MLLFAAHFALLAGATTPDKFYFGEATLDRIGATLGVVLVVGLAADRIGVTGDHEGRTFEAGIRQRPCRAPVGIELVLISAELSSN